MKIRSNKYPELSLRIGNSVIDFQSGFGETTAPTVIKAVRDIIKDKPEWGLEEIKDSGDENPEEGLV
jgi:hypothetical protein